MILSIGIVRASYDSRNNAALLHEDSAVERFGPHFS